MGNWNECTDLGVRTWYNKAYYEERGRLSVRGFINKVFEEDYREVFLEEEGRKRQRFSLGRKEGKFSRKREAEITVLRECGEDISVES